MFGPHSKPISACFGRFWLPADTTRFWPNWHELELSQRESVEKKKKKSDVALTCGQQRRCVGRRCGAHFAASVHHRWIVLFGVGGLVHIYTT